MVPLFRTERLLHSNRIFWFIIRKWK